MRVAFVTSFRPEAGNGVHVVAAQLGRSLVRAGVGVEFWHFRRDRDSVQERTDESGVDVVELPFKVVPGAGRLPHLRYAPETTKRWLREHGGRVDGVHFHSIFQPDSWSVLRHTERPYCVSPHGGYAMFVDRSWRNTAKLPLWWTVERSLLRGASFVIAGSDGDEESIRRLAPDANVSTFPTGVEVPEPEPPPPPADGHWLYVGRLHVSKKGLDLLVEGYARAARERQLPQLLIRGSDFRGGRAEVDALVAKYNLGDRVKVGGVAFGAERDELLDRTSLFIHTSRTEGLPMMLLEALAYGRPLAVTPGTNLTETVGAAGAGFVIDAPTPDAVASTLLEAAQAPHEEIVDRAARALALARSEYSWDQTARRVAALYEAHFN